MRFIWEEKDIIVGRYYYIAPDGAGEEYGLEYLIKKNLSYYASTANKIGYCHEWTRDALSPKDERKFVSISITDGCVYSAKTRKEFAKMLNKSGASPLDTNTLVLLINYLTNQNEGK